MAPRYDDSRLSRLRPEGSTLTWGELWTLCATYFTVGVAGAVVLVNAGTDRWVVIATAVAVNAITTPLAYLAAVEAGGSGPTAIVAGWLVATRFGLLAAAIGPRLWPGGWRRMLAAYSVFDPNTAFAARETDHEQSRAVFRAASLFLVPPWFVGAAVGALLADRLGDPDVVGLDAVLPAMLLAIIWPQLRSATGLQVGLAAAVIALALVEVTPGGVPAVAAVLAAVLALREPSAEETTG